MLRSALMFALIASGVMVIAQLAGVSSRERSAPSMLVFDGKHEQWMVKAPGSSSSRLSAATARLGGGKTSRPLDGDWYEVRLGEDVAAAEAEAAFGDAGATEVEPVMPRLPYSAPASIDTPAGGSSSSGRANSSTVPSSHDDSPGAFGVGSKLRNGPVNAPRISQQWALSQASDHDVDAPEAWQHSTGDGAVVAVIDTGVDATHPDLVGRVLDGRDFSGAATPATVDRVGHGTNVASIIAGNGTGMAGVAPAARILPLKVFRDNAGGFSMAGYLSAIRYAADQGVDAINISLGCGGTTSCYSQAELDALTYATSKGVVIVAAAGNGDSSGQGINNDDPQTPDFPSGYDLPALIAVTSSTRFGDLSTWANFGHASVDLAAPGESLLVGVPGGAYKSVTGTSFAAPLTAGTVALVAAAHPEATAEDLVSRVVGGVVRTASHGSKTASGGVLNANGALFALGSADSVAGGGGSVVRSLAPRSGVRVGTPPVLRWSLPKGWSSTQLRLRGVGGTFNRRVSAQTRAVGHPSTAWRSGTYRWSVQARDPRGRLVSTPTQEYRVLPRLGAWVNSGTIRAGGRSVTLRVGYASSEPRANVRVRIRAGRTVLHSGRSTTQRKHLRGSGSPRRGWISYDATLSRALRRGQRITVEVRVSAGGKSLTRRFPARVR